MRKNRHERFEGDVLLLEIVSILDIFKIVYRCAEYRGFMVVFVADSIFYGVWTVSYCTDTVD